MKERILIENNRILESRYSSFSSICMFCWSLFVLLYFFLLAIVFSVLLRYTDSDYPFGIFKLFLSDDLRKQIYICIQTN